LILQGFSQHLEVNSEKLRNYFVDFDGKLTLSVTRPDFKFGEQSNDWAGCFLEWQ
jgi:hypothetical protein